MAEAARALRGTAAAGLLALGLATAGCGDGERAGTADATGDGERPVVEAQASVDRAIATTGDLITYSVVVEHEPSVAVEIPEAGAEIAGFRIVDFGRDKPKRIDGRVVERRWYSLRADLVGSYILPPVTVAYRPADGDEGVSAAGEAGQTAPEADDGSAGRVRTSEIFVEVQSVLPADGEPTELRDIKPLQPLDAEPPWVWIAAGAAALALAAAALIFLLRRRRGPVAVAPEPPHEIAFRELDALRATDFGDPEAVRRFHFEISEIVRRYVEGRFGLNATDLTTEEILPLLAGSGSPASREIPAEERRRLERFLIAADRVKFAAHQPSEDEIRDVYEAALAFVEATRPLPEAESEPEPGAPAAPVEEAA